MSQSTPDARRFGPDWPSAIASSDGEHADALRPLEPDHVAVEQREVVVERLRHPLDELPRLRVEARRDVLGEPADLEVARVHARPGHHLREIHDQVALAERVPEHRDRTQLERRRAEIDEMRVDPVQLAQQHPHPRRLLRHLDREQLLDGEDEHELGVLVADVVDPLRVRDRLPPRLRLHRLLEAGVEVADHRREADDRLAVEVDDQAEDAVRGRMVRPEVDLHDVVRLVQLRRDVEDRRDARRDARALVLRRRDDRPGRGGRLLGRDRHSASENRTGSPPIG